MRDNMKTVLTIAGSDCSGGAGIQADIKTITVHNMYAMSVITAITAQNTTGVYDVMEIPAELIKKQLDCIFTDIYPDAVKIGMVSNAETIEVISDMLKHYNVTNIVIDPVMISTSGHKLLSPGATDSLLNSLFPLAAILTPNIPEANTLCSVNIKSHKDMEIAAMNLSRQSGTAVLIKGGHLTAHDDHKISTAADCLYYGSEFNWFESKWFNNPNTHGTGCTLSSAIACGLAAGKDLVESCKDAKSYLANIISSELDLGHGRGPLNHMYTGFNIKII